MADGIDTSSSANTAAREAARRAAAEAAQRSAAQAQQQAQQQSLQTTQQQQLQKQQEAAANNPDVAATVQQKDVVGADPRRVDAANAAGTDLRNDPGQDRPQMPVAEERPLGAVTDDLVGKTPPETASAAVLEAPAGGPRDAMIEKVAEKAGVEVPPGSRLEQHDVDRRTNDISRQLQEQAMLNPRGLNRVPGSRETLSDADKAGLKDPATRFKTAEAIGERVAKNEALDRAFGGPENRAKVEAHWASQSADQRRQTMNEAKAEAAQRSAQATAVVTAVVPFSDAAIKAAQGDTEGAAKSAATDAAFLAAGGVVGKVAGKVIGAVARKSDDIIAGAKKLFSSTAKKSDDAANATNAVAKPANQVAQEQGLSIKELEGRARGNKVDPNTGALLRDGWRPASLKDAVKTHAGEVSPVSRGGKDIYTNPQTGIEVVHDRAGGYFRIHDPKTKQYLDLNGKPLPDKVPVVRAQNNGTTKIVQQQLDAGIAQQLTHFRVVD